MSHRHFRKMTVRFPRSRSIVGAKGNWNSWPILAIFSTVVQKNPKPGLTVASFQERQAKPVSVSSTRGYKRFHRIRHVDRYAREPMRVS